MEGFGSGEMERGSVAGIELLTRTSLNSLRDANQVSSSYLWESLSQSQDDRNWSWAYLRVSFKKGCYILIILFGQTFLQFLLCS